MDTLVLCCSDKTECIVIWYHSLDIIIIQKSIKGVKKYYQVM